uniref:WGS project CBMI000000000 data, contig CS3069_c002403 n=1 Tax=Fusarium clavum TaxID=2594811 RepID=A0A090MCU3_9HYPO|nr:unnamed protein product [Fusarium clavum]
MSQGIQIEILGGSFRARRLKTRGELVQRLGEYCLLFPSFFPFPAYSGAAPIVIKIKVNEYFTDQLLWEIVEAAQFDGCGLNLLAKE